MSSTDSKTEQQHEQKEQEDVLVDPAACPLIKQKYEECFNNWYKNEFLKGNIKPGCEEEWNLYKACVMIAMREKKLDFLKPTKKEQK